MLTDFKVSLEADLVEFNRVIERGERSKSSMEIILNHLEADLPYSDSLKFHFGSTTETWLTQVNKSVFESLKSEGLSLISNKFPVIVHQDIQRLSDFHQVEPPALDVRKGALSIWICFPVEVGLSPYVVLMGNIPWRPSTTCHRS